MGKDFNKELDVLATRLQKQIYDLACLSKTEECKELCKSIETKYKIKDALEAIKYLNSEFNKNYEMNLERIINHYKCPLTNEVSQCANLNCSYSNIETILEKVAV